MHRLHRERDRFPVEMEWDDDGFTSRKGGKRTPSVQRRPWS
jgi:hypothetical protein